MREFFVRLYPALPREKFVTLTNGFDQPLADPAELEFKSSRRHLLHPGSLYNKRRIDTFCQALAGLVKQGKIDPYSFRILFLGDTSPSFAAEAYQQAPELIRHNCIELKPRVSWKQAQKALWAADLLLIFFDDKLAVPAKFYECLQTGKPIFAVAPEGALTDVLQSTGSGVWADPEDPTNISAKLLQALGQTPASPEEVQRRWSGQYHYRSLTARLAGWVRELVAAQTRNEQKL